MKEYWDKKFKRRHHRQKQRKINVRLRRQLFGHLFVEQCCYCRFAFLVDDLTIEHIIPLCKGGNSDTYNITLACAECNQTKGREAWAEVRLTNRKSYVKTIIPTT